MKHWLSIVLATALTACGGESNSSHTDIPASERPAPKAYDEILKVPVVIHLLIDPNPPVFDETARYQPVDMSTIKDEKLISQIAMTNQHFRAKNIAELNAVPEAYQPYIADTGIELVLATHDSDGNPTTGITRSPYVDKGKHLQWNPKRYLNIWVDGTTDSRGNKIHPGSAALPDNKNNLKEVGVYVNIRAIGNIKPLANEFNLGKTLTHEIGHFFGLHHNYGDHIKSPQGIISCDGKPNTSCSNGELRMSFMAAYAFDDQLKMFSISQANIMRQTLKTGLLKDAITIEPVENP